jgi:PAP2 superfamily
VERGRFGFAVLLSIGMAAAAVIIAVAYDLPLRDPDDAAGPMFVKLPAILLLAFLTDVVPRTVRRCRRPGDFTHHFAVVTRERWTWQHVRFMLLGLGSWYLTYVAFRNLKSYVPFVRSDLMDDQLDRLDRALLWGHEPAVLLHDVLGTGIAAHLMSVIYIAWIVMVPVSLAAALVWTRDVLAGSWYVTAVAVDWVLGVATYFAVPTVGPIYAHPRLFAALPVTDTSTLQASMWQDRLEVLHNPFGTDAVQTIAAFASLHVGIMVTACVIAELLSLHRGVRWALRLFLALTVLATVYLGWHYLADALGGAVLGAAAAWIGAVATGNSRHGWPVHRPQRARVAQPVS